MIKLARRCMKCGQDMPLEWGSKECKFCGGRVVVAVTEIPATHQRTRPPSPPIPGMIDDAMWGKKKFKPAKRIRLDDEALPTVETDRPRHTRLARPFAFFAASVATLGAVGAVWLFRMLSLMNSYVRDEERVRTSWCFMWLFAHAIAIILFVWCGVERAMSSSGWAITMSFAVCYFAVSFVMSRYYIFWLRNVLAETADRGEGRGAFDAHALALWYCGAAVMLGKIERAEAAGIIDLDASDESDSADQMEG